MDKVYKRKNLEVAWEKVKRSRGAGGVDGEDLAAFESSLEANLDRLHRELRAGEYEPQPVLRRLIPTAGQPGKFRPLGIPTIYDRVCQQALLNRLEPIFEPVFDDANHGYRQGRSAHGALRKIWRELDEGYEWVVDADLKDFFGSPSADMVAAIETLIVPFHLNTDDIFRSSFIPIFMGQQCRLIHAPHKVFGEALK